MRASLITAVYLILVAASASAVRADNIAFMSTNTGVFGTIDLNTGAFTRLGSSAVALGGMAAVNGTLYASSYNTTGSGTLYTVNPANGSLTVVGTSSINYACFGSTTSGVYAIGVDGNLYSINLSSGAAVKIGPTGFLFGDGFWAGLSNNANTLYFSNGAELYTLNTTTGATTPVGSTGGPQMGALLMENGVLYGGEESPSFAVATLNTATGAATTGPVVTGAIGEFYALAPYPLSTTINTAYMGTITGDFGTIDLDTGAFSKLGNSGVTLAGMAVANGTLYGCSYKTATGTLYTINPANGSLTTVGTSPIEYFAFGSTTSGLYVVGLDMNLYSINATSSAATLIGPTGIVLTNYWYGLSTNASTLYFSVGPSLYTIDTNTGAATLVGSTGGPQLGALLLEGGILYGGEDSPALAVATLDPTTGAATTRVGVTGTTGIIYALAPYPVPTAVVTLNPTTTPGSGDPGVTTLTVVGTGFPIGTIPPANVTVTLNPTTPGSGPSGTTQALAVTIVSGSTEGVTFQIPTTMVVSAPTSYQVSIAGTNSTGNAFQSGDTAALTIDPALVITTGSPLPAGKVNENYSQTISATGGSGQYTWAVTAGALPNGLSLAPATGLISGSPTTSGVSHFTIQVADSNQATANKAFAVPIAAPALITTVSPNFGNAGQNLQATITGSHTNFVQGATQASFGSGISVGGAADGQPGPVTVNSPTSATAQLAINPAAATGPQTVTVTTGPEQASLMNGFTVYPAVPTLTLLHSFASPLSGGAYPNAAVAIGSGGILFGTTAGGGTAKGIVFSLTPPLAGGNWSEAVLHTFAGAPSDGSQPEGDVVIDKGGVLYSTTYRGGSQNIGTVFAVTPPLTGGSWTETLLHQFSGAPGDGANPYAGVTIGKGGVLYGTTQYGGTGGCPPALGCGTVFSLTPPVSPGGAWTESVLHNFNGGSDGAAPNAGVVIGSGGVLYGTTGSGGTSGRGTVFMLTPPASPGGAWTETVIHSFTGGSDGSDPVAGVTIGAGGVLYGAALTGGSSHMGTVYMLTPPGTPGGHWPLTVLHTFTGGSTDGTSPAGSLAIGFGGVLYGTTQYGGPARVGIVFSLTPPAAPGGVWTEVVLHNFSGPTNDGARPQGRLVIDGTGLLYGTTYDGGADFQPGTVFSLTP